MELTLLRLKRTAMQVDAVHEAKGATRCRKNPLRASIVTALFTAGQRMHSGTIGPYLLLKVSVAEESARLDIQCTVPVATLNLSSVSQCGDHTVQW